MGSEIQNSAPAIRRHGQRAGARGELELRFHPAEVAVRAELMGASQRGFRIRYSDSVPLRIGSRVRVTYPWGTVYAEVVWCHPVDEWLEAGFSLVQDDSD